MISYGSVDLLEPTTELQEKIESLITLRDVISDPMPSWPGFFQTHLGFDGYSPSDKIELNTLRWPVGASRWAMFHGLVDSSRISSIRSFANDAGASAPQTLTMTNLGTVQTEMYLLPPRPLFDGLWLVTLVDERYWWWFRSGKVQWEEGDSWEGLFDKVSEEFGIGIDVDAIPYIAGAETDWIEGSWVDIGLFDVSNIGHSAYLEPSQDLQCLHQPLPLMLDAMAASIGQRVVRGLDGSVITQSASSARQVAAASGSWIRKAGGQFSFGSVGDQAFAVPESVSVVFPMASFGVVQRDDCYEKTVALASLLMGEYPDIVGTPGSKVIRSTAIANFEDPEDPLNDDELTDLADRIARDWYAWALPTWNLSVVGIYPWQNEGSHDVIWRHRKDACSTTVTPIPVMSHDEIESHLGSNGTLLLGWGGDGVFRSVTNHGDWITVPADFSLEESESSPEVGHHATIRMSSESDLIVSGFAGGVDGRRIRIWNVNTEYEITFEHDSEIPDERDRLICATGENITLSPNGTLEAEYLLTDERWRVYSPAVPVSDNAPDWIEATLNFAGGASNQPYTTGTFPEYGLAYGWNLVTQSPGSTPLTYSNGNASSNPIFDITRYGFNMIGNSSFRRVIAHRGEYFNPNTTISQTAGNATSSNQSWLLTVTNSTGGSYIVSLNDNSNSTISNATLYWYSNASTIKSAIEALPGISACNVTQTTQNSPTIARISNISITKSGTHNTSLSVSEDANSPLVGSQNWLAFGEDVAGSENAGIVTIVNQTFRGSKKFLDPIRIGVDNTTISGNELGISLQVYDYLHPSAQNLTSISVGTGLAWLSMSQNGSTSNTTPCYGLTATYPGINTTTMIGGYANESSSTRGFQFAGGLFLEGKAKETICFSVPKSNLVMSSGVVQQYPLFCASQNVNVRVKCGLISSGFAPSGNGTIVVIATVNGIIPQIYDAGSWSYLPFAVQMTITSGYTQPANGYSDFDMAPGDVLAMSVQPTGNETTLPDGMFLQADLQYW